MVKRKKKQQREREKPQRKKRTRTQPRKKKKPQPTKRPRQRVVMTPESKNAFQVITSPFKAKENSAVIPDGKGGESFPTTDKLRKVENNATWLADIQAANEQWIQFSPALCPRRTYNSTTGELKPMDLNYSKGLFSAFKSENPQVGWNILACTQPVYPYSVDSPAALIQDYTPPGASSSHDYHVTDQCWKDIEIAHVYYFCLPGAQLDCTRGNFGGPTNNFPCAPPSFSSGFQDSYGQKYTDDDATQQEMWQSAHQLELIQCYPMQLSAPMQVYRVIDFTYHIDVRSPESSYDDKQDYSLDEMRGALHQAFPDLSPEAIMEKVLAAVNTTPETIRYRCQVINPIAGVTQWEDFADDLGTTILRNTNFPIFKDDPSEDNFDVRSVLSARSNSTFKREPHQNPHAPQPDSVGNGPAVTSSFQAKDSGPFKHLRVTSDFTYNKGHNGTQRLTSLTRVDLKTLAVNHPISSAGTIDWHDDYKSVTTSAAVEFTGGLVEARRVVGFGMKLFSTEAAVTADGLCIGGELPMGLVIDLLNFQDQTYHFAPGNVDPTNDHYMNTCDWTPLENKMDEWTDRIESRLEDFNAFRSLQGVTVRYNPLQTMDQAEYVYTSADSKLSFIPVQVCEAQIPVDAYQEFKRSDITCTGAGKLRAEVPRVYTPACDGSENVPVIMFNPADPQRMNYAAPNTVQAPHSTLMADGLYFQTVLHTECLSSNVFPLETSDSIYDPNWEIYSRICAETSNFPIVVKGHSFASFFRKAARVARTAMDFGARAIAVGEVILPLLTI